MNTVTRASRAATNSAGMMQGFRASNDRSEKTGPATQSTRQRLMRACAKATPAEITALFLGLGELPPANDLRKPEVGLVMLRGRIGGDGAAFNVGEATVARAAVRLESGTIGFGWRLGRSVEAARYTAIADALVQDDAWKSRIIEALVHPLEARQQQARATKAEEAAATRVDFFTMSRGSE